MEKKKVNPDTNDYSEETVKKKRKLSKKNVAWLAVIVILQIALVTGGIIVMTPAMEGKLDSDPIDVIEEYEVTVRPNSDGTINIEYDILWRALSEEEPLTWVSIGLPNSDCELYTYTVTDNVENAEILRKKNGNTTMRLDFKDSYGYGESVRFGFEIKQGSMLSTNGAGYIYELVPGWFNEIPVESYCFRWLASDGAVAAPEGATQEDGFYVWRGSLSAGEYVILRVLYTEDSFTGAETVRYVPFDGGDAHNDLGNNGPLLALAIILALLLVIPEVYIVDSFVSYGRGRGFITEHGHPVHAYGVTNPAYIAAARAANIGHDLHGHGGRGGSGGSRGCACACACACAGGGRAGCSAKNGLDVERKR